jgi:hypothetical membrane protein
MTDKLVFGMNTASLLGFILMAIGLAMTGRGPRSRVFRSQIALALMIGGTILVCFGIYLKPPLLP